MEKNKKIIVIAAAILLVVVAIVSVVAVKEHNRKNATKSTATATPKSTATPSATPTYETAAGPTTTPEPTVPPGKAASPLTGKYIDEKQAAKRPFAVMYNNLSAASPQSGISQADILYECLTEGGITRLMGIFQSVKSDRIGSLRSARHYYVSFAKEWDAIYVHAGGSDKAYSYIDALGVDDLDGITGIESTLAFRDDSISAPHNLFATSDGINKCVKELGIRTDLQAKENNHFTFFDEDTVDESGKDASYVQIDYSYYTAPYLIYDEKTKLYTRYQFGGKHVDKNTGKALTFKNIIIMLVDEWDMDSQGRQDMDIADSRGKAIYISNGKATNIKWAKNENKNTMRFLDSDGKLLKVNKGKTYIAVVPLKREDKLVIKANS